MKLNRKFKILSIGFDSFLTNQFKKIVVSSDLKINLSFLDEVEVMTFKETPDLLVYFSQHHSGRNIKWIRDLLFHHPHLQIVLVLPKPDFHAVIHYFRSGILDIWGYPFDENEIVKTLQRVRHQKKHLKDHPLKMALHLFSQPQMFDSLPELAATWLQFLKVFAPKVLETELKSSDKVISTLSKSKINVNEKLHSFLNSKKGFVFGLRQDLFLIKFSPSLYYLVEVEFTSTHEQKKVITPYIIHLMKSVRDFILHQIDQKELQRLVLTDEITGLFNQRKLSIDLETSIRSGEKKDEAFSLLFIDIDYFKNVNDQYGHVTGSQLLIDMAEVLRTELRGADAIYRFGGDEFIVLLPQTKLEEAKKIALRLSESVKIKEFAIGKDKTYRLSLSIGLAEYPTDASTSKDIIDFADKMMYMSKKSGRGKVFHVTEVM